MSAVKVPGRGGRAECSNLEEKRREGHLLSKPKGKLCFPNLCTTLHIGGELDIELPDTAIKNARCPAKPEIRMNNK